MPQRGLPGKKGFPPSPSKRKGKRDGDKPTSSTGDGGGTDTLLIDVGRGVGHGDDGQQETREPELAEQQDTLVAGATRWKELAQQAVSWVPTTLADVQAPFKFLATQAQREAVHKSHKRAHVAPPYRARSPGSA